MDEKKIVFIVCVNDETEYAECKYYLDRLIVPEGYVTDILAVSGAPSMAAGYDGGKLCLNAEYKVYLHQDVFIINRNFIRDMLAVFAEDSKIGLMGCIGVSQLDECASGVPDWDTGKILHNGTPALMELSQGEGLCTDVEAVDGLLIATHGDIAWRHDLFDGWHFYDISQCMEYRRAGYRCVVARQEKPWCYHDNSYSRRGRYHDYARIFAEEYADIKPFSAQPLTAELRRLMENREQARNQIHTLVDMGMRKQVRAMFQKDENRGCLYLKEYQLLADIDACEELVGVGEPLWSQRLSAAELLGKLCRIKYLVKRLEYGACEDKTTVAELCGAYSVYAIAMTCEEYVVYREEVFCRVLEYYQGKHMTEQAEVWMSIGKRC